MNFFLYWHEFKNTFVVAMWFLAGRETWADHYRCSGNTGWNAMEQPTSPVTQIILVCVCVCVCVFVCVSVCWKGFLF